MKKFITIAVVALVSTIYSITINAQTVYPAEWGNYIESSSIPVPVLRTGEFESYTLVKTDRGIAFIGRYGDHFFPYFQDLTVSTVKVKGKIYYEAPNGDLCCNPPMERNHELDRANGAYLTLDNGEWILTPAQCVITGPDVVSWFANGAIRCSMRVTFKRLPLLKWYAKETHDLSLQKTLGML